METQRFREPLYIVRVPGRIKRWRSTGDIERREREVELGEWNECLRGRDSAETLARPKYSFCKRIWLGVRDGIRNYLITAA